MKKYFFFVVFACVSSSVSAWGQMGHRVVGLIAEKHLSKKALKNIGLVLGDETLAEASTFMDDIKTDIAYRHMSPWHYATIPDGVSYAEVGTPEEGDVIQTIERLISELKSKQFTDEDEVFALKCLVHLIGDIHQPLHVGNGLDRGANDFKLRYFRRTSNLHRVWDSQIIEWQNYSYTEYVDWINHPTKQELEAWSSLEAVDWANESKLYRKQCYSSISEGGNLDYRYNYENLKLINLRLLQGGIRLSNVLNDIYG